MQTIGISFALKGRAELAVDALVGLAEVADGARSGR